jgi:hypothetical protein
MATAAVEFTIPAPYNASFTNGEKGVGRTSAPTGEYRFARKFYNERGALYQLKLWCGAAATVYVGSSSGTLALQFTAPANVPLVTQLYLPAGTQRIDIRMTNASAGVTFGFALLLYHADRVVYASDNEGWVYNIGSTVADGEVPAVSDTSMPVLTILPNWADGVLERVSYLTDIPTSETGTEERRSLRRHPRREFDASFLRHGPLRARLDSFLLGIGRRMFWMPMWHEQYRPITGISGSTVSFPAGTLQLREFRVGDKVFVNAGDPDEYEVLTVGSINYDTDVLTWVIAPVVAWPAGSRMIPLRRARISDASEMSNPTDRVGRSTVRFVLVDPDHCFGASWGRCSPVWHFQTDRSQDISFSFDRLAYTLDNETGPVEIVDPGNTPFVTMRSGLLLRGREQMVAMRRFIDVAEGRAGRFYMPTRMRDIEPATDTISGTFFDAKPVGYTDYIQGIPDVRGLIGIMFNDGAPAVYRYVSGVQRIGDVETFSVSESLPVIRTNTISRIQFMVPSRFDQDTFEFHHKVDDAAAVSTSVVTRSVDGTGMPPIDCFETSPPYPLGPVEEMQSGVSITAGRMLQSPTPVELMETSLAFVAGTLEIPLETYNGLAEGMDANLTMMAGTLAIPLETTSVAPEALDVDMEITGGSLDVVLLTYTEKPEALDAGIAIVAGALT